MSDDSDIIHHKRTCSTLPSPVCSLFRPAGGDWRIGGLGRMKKKEKCLIGWSKELVQNICFKHCYTSAGSWRVPVTRTSYCNTHQQRNRCVSCIWLSVLQLQIFSYRASEMSQFITVCLQITAFSLVSISVSAISSVRFGKCCCTGDDPWRLQTPVENDTRDVLDDLCIWQTVCRYQHSTHEE